MSALRPTFRRVLAPLPRLYSSAAAADASAPAPPVVPAPKTTVRKSTINAGEVLYNINYFKNKPDLVALEDSDYPEWLWGILEKDGKKESEEEIGDLYSKSKKARRIAKKRAEKAALLAAKNPEVKVPIEEQTLDLPFVAGPESNFSRPVAAVGPVVAKAEGKTTVVVGGKEGVEVTEEEARLAREELKKALRKKGRSKIKEGNYLAQM